MNKVVKLSFFVWEDLLSARQSVLGTHPWPTYNDVLREYMHKQCAYFLAMWCDD